MYYLHEKVSPLSKEKVSLTQIKKTPQSGDCGVLDFLFDS